MRLVTFEIQRFRSIVKSTKLNVDNELTVILGPNNEGKSNVLRALVVALESLRSIRLIAPSRLKATKSVLEMRLFRKTYNWAEDYPVGLQEANPTGKSVFTLEFELNPREITAFKSRVKSNLNGTLPIKLTLGNDVLTFQVPKRGPGAKSLTKKAPSIAQFVGSHFEFQYISGVRTAEQSQEIVDGMVEESLDALSNDPNYQKALKLVEALEAPILRSLSDEVLNTLRSFLPKVKSVEIKVDRGKVGRSASHRSSVIVDDGEATPLNSKGDGIQSLAAISLMRGQTIAKGLVVAIEEPECHLHPGAIRQLAQVLREIAEKHQLIITTHCPLLTQQRKLSSNIIVSNSTAKPATSIKDIRQCLGVELGDNLQSAAFVLLVEGVTDRDSLQALMFEHSESLASALESRTLVIEGLGGASNLSHRSSAWGLLMCAPLALLDNDQSGRAGVKKAVDSLSISASRTWMTTRQGLAEAELEDWFDTSIYAAYLKDTFKVDLRATNFNKGSKKWSARLKKSFDESARLCDEEMICEIKREVSALVQEKPSIAISKSAWKQFDAFLTSLEDIINAEQ